MLATKNEFATVAKNKFITKFESIIANDRLQENHITVDNKTDKWSEKQNLRVAFLSIDLNRQSSDDNKHVELLNQSMSSIDVNINQQAVLMTRSLLIQCSHHLQLQCAQNRTLQLLFDKFSTQNPEQIAEFQSNNPQSPVLSFLAYMKTNRK